MTGTVQVQTAVEEPQGGQTTSQENAAEHHEPNAEEIVTIKDMCRVARTDIKNQRLKNKLLDLVYFCAGSVMGAAEYRKLIQNAKDKDMVKKIHEIADLDSFRKEFVQLLTMYINIRAKLPHYVILFG